MPTSRRQRTVGDERPPHRLASSNRRQRDSRCGAPLAGGSPAGRSTSKPFGAPSARATGSSWCGRRSPAGPSSSTCPPIWASRPTWPITSRDRPGSPCTTARLRAAAEAERMDQGPAGLPWRPGQADHGSGLRRGRRGITAGEASPSAMIEERATRHPIALTTRNRSVAIGPFRALWQGTSPRPGPDLRTRRARAHPRLPSGSP